MGFAPVMGRYVQALVRWFAFLCNGSTNAEIKSILSLEIRDYDGSVVDQQAAIKAVKSAAEACTCNFRSGDCICCRY